MASSRRKRTKGRRANYAPNPTDVGLRRFLPVGWANWLGFGMFGFICVALCAEVVAATVQHRGLDPVAAAIMAVAFAWITYLFGTNRITD